MLFCAVRHHLMPNSGRQAVLATEVVTELHGTLGGGPPHKTQRPRPHGTREGELMCMVDDCSFRNGRLTLPLGITATSDLMTGTF